MAKINLRDASKVQWTQESSDSNGYPGNQSIHLGCLMRIADASEVMAKNHNQLISDRDWYKKMYEAEEATSKRLSRRIAALKGYIKRLKKGK